MRPGGELKAAVRSGGPELRRRRGGEGPMRRPPAGVELGRGTRGGGPELRRSRGGEAMRWPPAGTRGGGAELRRSRGEGAMRRLSAGVELGRGTRGGRAEL